MLPQSDMEQTYQIVEDKIQEIKVYMRMWYQYQSLWDFEIDYVYPKIGKDISKWQQLISEIRKARQTFDTSRS